MSLWTPDGERPVSADAPDGPEQELTPEQEEQLRERLAEVREYVLGTDAITIMVNHVLGIIEVARIHLLEEEPNLTDAALAIDSAAAIVDRLGNRLGELETPLRLTNQQLQNQFVERSRVADPAGAGEAAPDQ